MGIFFLYKKHPAKKIPDLEITCYRKEWVLFALCNIGTLVSIARNIFSIVKVVSILIANIVSILIAVEQLFLLLFFFFLWESVFWRATKGWGRNVRDFSYFVIWEEK